MVDSVFVLVVKNLDTRENSQHFLLPTMRMPAIQFKQNQMHTLTSVSVETVQRWCKALPSLASKTGKAARLIVKEMLMGQPRAIEAEADLDIVFTDSYFAAAL